LIVSLGSLFRNPSTPRYTTVQRNAKQKISAMSDRVPLMSERAVQIAAEHKLRAAIAAGEFDNLPGFGKPSPVIDEPYDPMWWVRRKLKREEVSATKVFNA
jgi:hypothetical protein